MRLAETLYNVINYAEMAELREIAKYAVKIHFETGFPIEEITKYEMALTAHEQRLVNREATRQLNRISN